LIHILASAPSGDLSRSTSPRLLSIDALRGFDMFWIIGGDAVVSAWAHWAQWAYQEQLDDQLEHVRWACLATHRFLIGLASRKITPAAILVILS
jgi:hypothetical protein